MLKKILVVEDNEDNRRILVYRLRKIGQFDIREAANGQQAIEAVRADLPDLIFMDLKMPVMDGWEATKRIREMDGGDSVRIIALTAQAMAGDEQKALAIGCDDYLAKPRRRPLVALPQPVSVDHPREGDRPVPELLRHPERVRAVDEVERRERVPQAVRGEVGGELRELEHPLHVPVDVPLAVRGAVRGGRLLDVRR